MLVGLDGQFYVSNGFVLFLIAVWPRPVASTVYAPLGAKQNDRCLLQQDARIKRATLDKGIPAHWFNGFSGDESSFDADHAEFKLRDDPRIVPSELVRNIPSIIQDANRPVGRVGSQGREGIRAEWFEESASGGPDAAWRTRFPELESDGVALDKVPFLPDHIGLRVQDYIPTAATSIAHVYSIRDSKHAGWFEESVDDYDRLGRRMPATAHSDRWYYNWTKESWSVPIGCEKSGCMANATLKTFDSTKFQHAKCQLSFKIHATDFDDEYSREYVEWLLMNEMRVMKFCDPMTKGCGRNQNVSKRGMHPCLTDYPIDDLLTNDTTLKFASKISEMVDECPVDNKLLNGNISVTCFLRPWPPPPKKPNPQPPSSQCVPYVVDLRCREHGCNASAAAKPCYPPQDGEKCMLTVKIWQTDFDQDHGSVEVVEWVKVNGEEVETSLKPGKKPWKGRNPCKEALEGKPKSDKAGLLARGHGLRSSMSHEAEKKARSRSPMYGVAEDRQTMWSDEFVTSKLDGFNESFALGLGASFRNRSANGWREVDDVMETIVKERDVTKEILANGSVLVEAKISQMVDECAKDGYLLNAEAFIKCK